MRQACMRLAVILLLNLIAMRAAQSQTPAQPQPIYAAYFYDTNCQPCSGAQFNIDYLSTLYPQLVIHQFNAREDEALGRWLARRAGKMALEIPALFIADETWMGEIEFTPANIQAALDRYTPGGSSMIWEPAALIRWRASLSRDTPALSGLQAILFGAVDGIFVCIAGAFLFMAAVVSLRVPIRGMAQAGAENGRALSATAIIWFAAGLFMALAGAGLAVYGNPARAEAWFDVMRFPASIFSVVSCVGLGALAFLRQSRPGLSPVRISIAGQWVMAGVVGLLVAMPLLASVGRAHLPAVIYLGSIFTNPLLAFLALMLYNAVFVLPTVIILLPVFRWVNGNTTESPMRPDGSGVRWK